MAVRLSEGSIVAIMQGENAVNPILQLINIRAISTGSGPPRYRMLMSDGVNTLSSFMLATQLNSLVDDQRLSANAICQINKFIVNVLKDGRRVVILMDLDVLKAGGASTTKIGNPVPYAEGAGHGGQPQQQTSAPATGLAASKPAQPQHSSPGAGSATRCTVSSKALGKASDSSFVSTPGGSQSKVVPIASLNPYQSKWTIRARVTQKGQIRTWSNSRGQGKLFSIELMDESGEIRATAFNDDVDTFYPLIELNKVYYLSKGNLKMANRQYTAVKNDYEITFYKDTSVIPCEGAIHLPVVQYNFTSIADLEKEYRDTLVDVIGICKSSEEVTKVMVKSTNREVSKRDIQLMDMSGKSVTVTLWAGEAESFDGSKQPVLILKGVKVSDFSGRSLSVISTSNVILNPDHPEAFKLRGWYDSEGQFLESSSISTAQKGDFPSGISNWKFLYEAKLENLGQGDKPDYFTCVATVSFLRKENCMYQACPSEECNKKVIDQENGLYRCEKCNRDFPNFKYRMIMQVNIADFCDNQWITCFQPAVESILGHDAAYLGELKEKNEPAFDEVLQNTIFSTFEFRIRVKLETFNDETRVKTSALEVKPVDHKEYARWLIMKIRKNTSYPNC